MSVSHLLQKLIFSFLIFIKFLDGISTANPPQCDASKFSNVTTGHVKATSSCYLSTPYEKKCRFWRISTVGMVSYGTPQSIQQHVSNFMYTLCKNCDTLTQTDAYVPDKNITAITETCTFFNVGTAAQLDYFLSYGSTIAYLPPDENGGDAMEFMLENLMNCTIEKPLAHDQGGVVFIFTNVPCVELCTEKLVQMQTKILNTIFARGFIARIVFFDLPGQDSSGCIRSLFSACGAQPSEVCDFMFYTNSSALDSVISQNIVCKVEKPKLPTIKLVMMIALPILCTAIIIPILVYLTYMRRRFLRENQQAAAAAHKDCAGFSKPATKNSELWEISLENLDFEEKDLIGRGAFASVYKGRLKGDIPVLAMNPGLSLQLDKQNDIYMEVAIKKLPPNTFDELDKDELNREIAFMKRLGCHLHIVSMLGCVSIPEPMIIVEYCENGDMLSYLRRRRNLASTIDHSNSTINSDLDIRVKELISISWQICDGMNYLSSHNFIHRDLAARNVLLTKNLVAKIGDFGLCRYSDAAVYTSKTGKLPIKWMAIESLRYNEFSTQSDVWSYGVVLFEIFSLGDGPYAAIQPEDMVDHLLAGNRLEQPTKCPNEIYEIMKQCWGSDPNSRRTFSQIRDDLTTLLNMDAENYGYLQVLRLISERNTLSFEENHTGFPFETANAVHNTLSSYHWDVETENDTKEERIQTLDNNSEEDTSQKMISFLTSVDPSRLWEIEMIAKDFRLQSVSDAKLED